MILFPPEKRKDYFEDRCLWDFPENVDNYFNICWELPDNLTPAQKADFIFEMLFPEEQQYLLDADFIYDCDLITYYQHDTCCPDPKVKWVDKVRTRMDFIKITNTIPFFDE